MKQHRSTSRAARFAVLLLLSSGCPNKDGEVGVFDVPQHVGDGGGAASPHHPTGSSTLAVTLTSSAAEVCPDECVELVASASGGQAPYQYNWEIEGLTGPGPHHVCPTEPTTYLVTVVDSQFSDTGVEVGARVTVARADACVAIDPPDAGDDAGDDVPGSPLGLALTASASEVCPGECVDLTASASGGLPPYQYNWELSDLSGPGPQQVCPTETTTYQAFAFDADFERTGLEVGASTQVTVRPSCEDEGPLTIALGSSADSVCAGACVELTATASGGRAPYQYNWEANHLEGPGPHSVCPTETTTYWAFAFDADFDTNGLEVGAQKVITVDRCP